MSEKKDRSANTRVWHATFKLIERSYLDGLSNRPWDADYLEDMAAMDYKVLCYHYANLYLTLLRARVIRMEGD